MDKNNDGHLTKNELKKGYFKVMGKKKTGDIDKIFESVDFNNNGIITREEFITASIDREKFLSEEHLKKEFRRFKVKEKDT